MSLLTNSRGFTFLELLVSMAIFAILMAIALPKISEVREVMNRNSAELTVMQDLRWLQAKSVEQGCRGILVPSGTNNSYTMGCDYVPFNETADPLYDVALETHYLPPGIEVTPSERIIFNTRGQAVNYLGSLNSKTVTLKSGGSVYKTGTISATGFFDYNS